MIKTPARKTAPKETASKKGCEEGAQLRGVGLNADAIKHYEKILELNPNDNQGVRDPLVGLYLATGNLDGARKLLKEYEEGGSANMLWARVLYLFLSDDKPGAAAALEIARENNSFVEQFMSGRKSLPKAMPEMYSVGSEEEAVLLLDTRLHQKSVRIQAEQG